jgi:hypothetical protein
MRPNIRPDLIKLLFLEFDMLQGENFVGKISVQRATVLQLPPQTYTPRQMEAQIQETAQADARQRFWWTAR